ncbi:hypothetical protein PPTG_23435 [Phytophthora nicotianae INRA-310]|uniref:Uncharacterized protein n=1 Tax=Phytophthora nicotianae (strain INRA-310) TaxID=761204 RepID=W2PYT3_PHYN3|nr:hypothetical protein PPTG_23435 [Phytophthora nicotianae INRA-310]ETN05781.1 hypothetical protein PPTG_23435 [Phytophthora nicotianae INRA-310]
METSSETVFMRNDKTLPTLAPVSSIVGITFTTWAEFFSFWDKFGREFLSYIKPETASTEVLSMFDAFGQTNTSNGAEQAVATCGQTTDIAAASRVVILPPIEWKMGGIITGQKD